jgi:acyl transferase domain-containing protein/3-hydroxymyristoyl/3-hydroxydecanoyl-(acyl carrier protein) dehydratase
MRNAERAPAIAIVGRACVLPGALNPAALWDAVQSGRDLITTVPAGRWRLPPERALCDPTTPQPDRCGSDRGGYVVGFEAIWNPDGFAIPAAELAGLDPLLHWLLHCSREALSELRSERRGRIGAVFGNLGFPSESMATYADQIWRDGHSTLDPRNRFMSGGTAALLAEALRLDAGSLSLDAACASSLYAIKLACDRLREGSADLMLAGAVQRADDLFLHQGFAALNALSTSGRSRPFHRDADGLLPAEGCAMLVLKRLADARRDGDTVHAVIRGIGLSNDGRGRGLLVPDAGGQQRAMRDAYSAAGIDPRAVSLLECHATGTTVGDATELASSAAVFAAANGLPIGSLKSNLGHLITVAGAAGIIKLIEAMRAGVRPPTLHVDAPTEALAGTPFRLLERAEPWPCDGPRIAALSAFGFGGNNAHIVLSEDDPALPLDDVVAASPRPPIAVVGIGALVGGCADRASFSDALFGGVDLRNERGESPLGVQPTDVNTGGEAPLGRRPTHRHSREGGNPVSLSATPKSLDPRLRGDDGVGIGDGAGDIRADADGSITLDLAGLRFPPRDLQQALPQQLAILQAAREALAETGPLPRERTAILIGMEPDAEVARFGTRWRLANEASGDTLATLQATLIAPLEAAGVLGCMPNIPANRLSSQFDLAGPGYTVQAGAQSGLQALQIAVHGLAAGEFDAALVGAVDLGCEAVNRSAATEPPADAAVVLLLKRLDDAERDGDRIHALLDSGHDDATSNPLPSLRDRLGHAGAADDLLRLTAATFALHHRQTLQGRPWLSAQPRQFDLALEGYRPLRLLEACNQPRRSERPLPRLHVYAGADRAAVIDALRRDLPNADGPARLVLIASDDEHDALRVRALAHLEQGAPAGHAIHYREHPLQGGIAFVFAGAGASYPGMGRALLQHLPQLQQGLAQRSQRLATALEWAFDPTVERPSVVQQLWGSSALSQLHVELSERVLGLRADAWLGYSSGETNALVAAGVWSDADALIEQMESGGLATDALGGAFSAIKAQWGKAVDWASWTVLAPIDEVRQALQGIERVHLAIINGDADCLIAGEAAGCEQLVDTIGRARCLPLDYPLAVHVPELAAVEADWLDLHRRHTDAPRHGRIYSTAWAEAYTPSPERCAQAILAQANRCLDIRPLVLAAWNDGVRVFIEHGPRGAFGRAIRGILGERDALVVSLDRQGQGIEAVLHAAAALLAAGVPVEHERLQALLAPAKQLPPAQRPMQFAAHWPIVRLHEAIETCAAIPTRDAPKPLSHRDAPKPLSPRERGWGEGPSAALSSMTTTSALPATAAFTMATDSHQPAVQFMAPAPRLPAVLASLRNDVSPNNSSAAIITPAPHQATVAAADVETAAHPTVLALAGYRAHLAQLAAQHSGYLDLQASAHAHYLRQRGVAQSVLARAASLFPTTTEPLAGRTPQAASPLQRHERASDTVPHHRHSREGGNPVPFAPPTTPTESLDSRLRGNDGQSERVAGTLATSVTAEASLDSRLRGNDGQSERVAGTLATTVTAETSLDSRVRGNDGQGAPGPIGNRDLAVSPTADIPRGPHFTREQLQIHADGRIADIFGESFAGQAAYAKQVRMPKPPLLLADRVLGIDGAAGSMGRGRIWTETDVAHDAWYLHQTRMPAGVMIEAGQADLMLISWLGVDALNRGERVYRLLGCELTYHGDLPSTGDTLRFDIHLDGHAAQGDVRLMFFHYDCTNGARPQLSVRQGQAGFFTDAELADSAGCLWSPQTQAITDTPRLDPPEVECRHDALSRAQLEAFAAGDSAACFGPGFEFARTHSRSPSIHAGRMLLLDRVTELAPNGGPWQRGYLRAELDIDPQQWFFDGHFKNDPCMPGTLMFEACLQAMALYLAGCGYSLRRDGWRFQPVPELPYQLQCRGQVTPRSKLLVTEVFVEERIAGPVPTVYADLLCTVDGLKAFHARRVALQLVPDWPLEALPPVDDRAGTVVAEVDGFRFGQQSLLACAHGRPSNAFGPIYRRFDGPTRVARLPSPPYLFISRIAEVHGPIGVMRAGARVIAEYDIPDEVWYLEQNGGRTMPFAVLLEAALQPCGWLSSYVGSALTVDAELGFRNLDGEGVVLAELHGGDGVLRTEVELTDVSASAGMIIETFVVRCWLGQREVYRLRTVFGFFPPDALAAQAGLPISDGQRELLQREANIAIDFNAVPIACFDPERLHLPGPMLRMIDRIDGHWPDGGAAGLGALRAVKAVDPAEWFFKAHFFSDPVQPGSLGLEAMLQTLQFHMLHTGMDAGIEAPRFESIALDHEHRWKYRGQVLPQHREVHTTMEITATGSDARGIYALADASLWVDGKRIYEARGLGVRIVPGRGDS